eukprot:gene34126-44094_t
MSRRPKAQDMKGFDNFPDNEREKQIMGDNGALSPLSYTDTDLAAYIQVWAGTIVESDEQEDVQEGGARGGDRGDAENASRKEGQEDQYAKDQAETNKGDRTHSQKDAPCSIVGSRRRYGTINVQTLAMKDDRQRKESDGRVAGATEWANEFEGRGLGVVGLQECRVPGKTDGQEGDYRTFYSGNVEGKCEHGVGVYLHKMAVKGEFDIQQISERLMWVYGSVYGKDQAVFSVYAPTNRSDNRIEVADFYAALEKEVRKVREAYGANTSIIILGDFNARVGKDGADNREEECDAQGEECVIGTFGFAEINDNGLDLTVFCKTGRFKIMDTYFEREDGDYGTWAANSSKIKGYKAVLDHILVSTSLWGAVEHCGVYIPVSRLNTDHRMVELDLGGFARSSTTIRVMEEERPKGKPSAEIMARKKQKSFNQYILRCKLNMDPDKELQRLSESVEQMVTSGRKDMVVTQGEEGPTDRATTNNAEKLLQVLSVAVRNTMEKEYPDGVPASNRQKGRHWNSANREIQVLYKQQLEAIRRLGRSQLNGVTGVTVKRLTETINVKQRKIRENLRMNRDQYWLGVADELENAYEAKDMKLYYKLIKEAHGHQLSSTAQGRQALQGQHMKKPDKTKTSTGIELEARWIEHFTDLFNQPGEVDANIAAYIPEQRETNEKIKVGDFDIKELRAAVKDMANDKAAGLDGFSIEIEKYLAGEEYLRTELAAFNEIRRSGQMPAILRDVLYKGKGPKDDCNSYRGISLMSHRGKLLERLILNRLKPALKDLIPDNQFGFTACPDAQMVSRLLGIDAQKGHIGLVRAYIDLTKAYDKVNREVLWTILRRLGIPEEIVLMIVAFHEASKAVLLLNGELSMTPIELNRGLKQGSVLSPVLFNIFFGVLIKVFEMRCAMQTTETTVLGVEVLFNLRNGFMDDKQIQGRVPGYGTTTVTDVLYADDCILFTNTIRAMQTMIVIFDEVATIFGMELAIGKTKVVCNHFSKAMELEIQEEEGIVHREAPHNTRLQHQLAQLVATDTTVYVPVITVRGETVEVVAHFRYLGAEDKDDGSLGAEIQARICRMKQRFKEFEGRIFCNTRISTLPRMQVFKCIVMTNGTYACEVWNYTRADIDRLEKHYFRLLRDTLLMSKYSTTYTQVLDKARSSGVVKAYSIECYIQRQQLKFLWKVMHLNDLALQKIVLHGKLDAKYSMGRGGRTRTYKQCITDALGNFGVSMSQCIESGKQEWTKLIEETGMAAAMQKWEGSPKAGKALDVDWKSSRGKLTSGTRAPVATALEMAIMVDADGDGAVGRSADSSSEDEVLNDEFSHCLGQSQNPRTEELIQQATVYSIGGEVHRNSATRTDQYARRNKKDKQWQDDTEPGQQAGQTARLPTAAAAHTTTTIVVDPQVEKTTEEASRKRSAKTVVRNTRRHNKKARIASLICCDNEFPQRELMIIVGEDNAGNHGNEVDKNIIIPWEHRGMLGRTN